MEEISKKDLLILTGISYGQLYRWKRKGLIPEEWFIKRASFTGQETYFPKELILERIDKILELKEDVSLEELSEIINKKNLEKVVHLSKLKELNLYMNVNIFELTTNENLSFLEIVALKIIDNIYPSYNNLSGLKSFYEFLIAQKNALIDDYKVIYVTLINDSLKAIFGKTTDNLFYNLHIINTINIESLINNIKLIVMI